VNGPEDDDGRSRLRERGDVAKECEAKRDDGALLLTLRLW